MTTTTTCPGCGTVLALEEIPGKPGRLQGRCRCNSGRPVIEMPVPVVEKRKKEKRRDEGEDILDGSYREDDSSEAVHEIP